MQKNTGSYLKNQLHNQSRRIYLQIILMTIFKAINNPSDPFFQPDDYIVYFNEHFLKSEMEIIFDELNSTITETEICKVIKQLKNGKSGGPICFWMSFSYSE